MIKNKELQTKSSFNIQFFLRETLTEKNVTTITLCGTLQNWANQGLIEKIKFSESLQKLQEKIIKTKKLEKLILF